MDRQDTIQFSDEEDNGTVWGKIVALNGKVPNKNLTANEYTFGRSANNSIVINDKRLSGTHTKITKEGNKAYVYDLSTNGTYLEDNKLGKNAKSELSSGAKFYLLHPSKVGNDDILGYVFAYANDDISDLKQNRGDSQQASSNGQNNSQQNDQMQKQLKLADELGEEMQCSICIDYVYQCVTLIPCLHNFCAACFSDWMKKSDACPQCRDEVAEVKKNAAINNMVEKFLAAHPDKKRSAQEYAAMDSLNKITQDRIVLKSTSNNGAGSKKKKEPEEEKDDGDTCLECRTARPADGFKCNRNNKAHLTCTACKRLFPDRRDQYSQECSICNETYCNLYWKCPTRRGDKIEELQNLDVVPNLQDKVFRGNKYEVKLLRDYLEKKKLTCKGMLQEFLQEVVDKKNFKYKAHKSMLQNPPAVNHEIAMGRKSPVCTKCFDEVWFQICFRYREFIKPHLPSAARERKTCWYGMNCKTMLHNDDHSKKLDHICEQARFS